MNAVLGVLHWLNSQMISVVAQLLPLAVLGLPLYLASKAHEYLLRKARAQGNLSEAEKRKLDRWSIYIFIALLIVAFWLLLNAHAIVRMSLAPTDD